MDLQQILEHAVRFYGHRTAVVCGTTHLTYLVHAEKWDSRVSALLGLAAPLAQESKKPLPQGYHSVRPLGDVTIARPGSVGGAAGPTSWCSRPVLPS
jgi:hypothetical protein